MRTLTLALILLALALAPGPLEAHAAPTLDPGTRDAVQARPALLIVRLDLSGASLNASHAAPITIAQAQAEVLDALRHTGWRTTHHYLTLPALAGVADVAALDTLLSHPRVIAVGPDAPIRGAADVGVPFIGADATRASTGRDGSGVTVAIFDSGIDTDHPEFADRIIAGRAFLDQGTSSTDIEDDHGHGTNVAGLIAATGQIAPPGVAPGASLLVYKVLSADNTGWASDWAAAVDHAVANIALWPSLRVSNSSLVTGTLFSTCPCEDGALAWLGVVADAYQSLEAQGVLNTASSGNNGARGEMAAPACLSSTIAVGAVHERDRGRSPTSGTYRDDLPGFGDCADFSTGPDVLACFTNISPCLDIFAPGVSMQTTDRVGLALAFYTGTSQASPLVAGAAVLGVAIAPNTTPTQLRDALLSTGAPVTLPDGSSTPRVDTEAMAAALLPCDDAQCIPNDTITLSCGVCGQQQRTCDDACQWVDDACIDDGVCAPGDAQTEACGACGQRQRACSDACQWSPWSDCQGAGVCTPDERTEGPCGACGTQPLICTAECTWRGEGACLEPLCVDQSVADVADTSPNPRPPGDCACQTHHNPTTTPVTVLLLLALGVTLRARSLGA